MEVLDISARPPNIYGASAHHPQCFCTSIAILWWCKYPHANTCSAMRKRSASRCTYGCEHASRYSMPALPASQRYSTLCCLLWLLPLGLNTKVRVHSMARYDGRGPIVNPAVFKVPRPPWSELRHQWRGSLLLEGLHADTEGVH